LKQDIKAFKFRMMHRSGHAAGMPATLSVEGTTLRCAGDWTARNLGGLERRLMHLNLPAQGDIRLDMSGVHRMDTSGAWLLQRLVGDLEARTVDSVEIEGLSTAAAGLLELVRETKVRPGAAPRPARKGALERIALSSVGRVAHSIDLLAFLGEMASAWVGQVFRPNRIRWREIVVTLGEAGHKALPIVGLLAFLLGVVIAYQGGVQLRQYGASIFVADLVGLSMIRELAPLLTAIIVAGRTGSAYTAQIGTMKVTEEIDALRSIGISPMGMLVLPKLFALFIALPLLTVYADIMGILGGMVMASVQLDIAFTTYLDRLEEALTLDSYLVGIGKAPVFALIIATLGCYQGFRVDGSAESVGWRTTQSVVQSIIAVIVVDAAFSVAFSYLGI
jgi:phospholipid/cholesterol/gamma-HCH transport system permease protein